MTKLTREQFEEFISLPPYEKSVLRYGDDINTNLWPGQYRNDGVQLAWEAWQQAYDAGVRAEREECAKVCDEKSKKLLSIIGLPVVQSEIVQRDRARVWAEAGSAIRARTG